MDPLVVTQVMNVIFAVTTLAAIVLGLAIVFGWLGVMNLAHGEFVMMGAYSAFFVQSQGWPFLTAIPVALAVTAALGFVVERWLIRPLYARPFDIILATWGLSLLLREVVELAYGAGFQNLNVPVSGSIDILGAQYPSYRGLIIVVSVLVLGLLAFWYFRSSTGARVKAMVDNPELAKAVGIRTDHLARNTFIFGTCLGGLAGVMVSPLTPVNPFMGLDFVLNGFFVIVVGGLGSVLGLAAGAVVVGGLDSVAAALLNRTFGFFAVLFVAILFLWLRPRGIFSRS